MFNEHTTEELKKIADILKGEVDRCLSELRRLRTFPRTEPYALWESITWEMQLAAVQEEIHRRETGTPGVDHP